MNHTEALPSRQPPAVQHSQTVSALARSLGVSPSTVSRWTTRGVRTRRGRAFLCAERIGGRLFVRAEAWEAFRAALNHGRKAVPLVTPRERESAAREAGEALGRIGI